eukprot:jgi/Chrzof1/2146/Cz11g04010.t1
MTTFWKCWSITVLTCLLLGEVVHASRHLTAAGPSFKNSWQHKGTTYAQRQPTKAHYAAEGPSSSTQEQQLTKCKPAAPTVAWGCSNLDRSVALTFDDGPSDFTSELLDTLAALKVKATFFVVGGNAQQRPDIIRRMVADGHDVGSHTWSHANLTHLWVTGNLAELNAQINQTEQVLQEITGVKPWLIRPPYGAINTAVQNYLAALGYTVVMWSGGCIDWYFHNWSTELQVYVNGLADAGGLLCMHDTAPSTCQNIAALVTLLRDTTEGSTVNPQGRALVNMSQCLNRIVTNTD